MKPIIVDMKEMSDSREVYESRPHPFFVWFIYLLVVITMVAVVWAAVFKIDIVVTGTGTVEAKESDSVVTNIKSGIVTECYIADGQKVEKGELLYEVEHDDLELQLENYENRLAEYEQQLEMMNGYLDWLSGESNSLETYADNPYYMEYFSRSRLVELNSEAVVQEYNNTQDTYQAQLYASEELVSYYECEIDKLMQLSTAVKTRSNPFSDDEVYYYAKAEDYIAQYNNLAAQYDESITELQDGAEDENPETSQSVELLESQKQSALSTLETETVAGIEASILSYQQNLLTSQGSQEEIESAISSNAQTGTEASVENLKQTEIQAITTEIGSCQTQVNDLETTIAEIESEIEDTAVCAPASGTINLMEEIVQGNYIVAGADVLTIIPDGADGFVVQSYIDNGDIAQIEENMPVKYEIAACPSSEYGVITGEVSFVSADLKVSDETGSAYYMIETTLDDANLCTGDGETAALKIGMLCETKIIVEQKSVLRYLLDKMLN